MPENRIVLRGSAQAGEPFLYDVMREYGPRMVEYGYNATRDYLNRTFSNRRNNKRQRTMDDPEYKMVQSYKSIKRALNKGTVHWTWCQYVMSPSVLAYSTGWQTKPGRGPALCWATVENATQTGIQNTFMPTAMQTAYSSDTLTNAEYGALRPSTNVSTTHPFVTNNWFFDYGTIYTFVADWPFLTMHWDKATQFDNNSGTTHKNCLEWEYVPYNNNEDASSPIQLTTPANKSILWNNDWQKMTHLATHISFDFTNIAPYPMCVEVLIMKILPDLDSINYRQSCRIVTNGFSEMDSYAEQRNTYFGVANYVTVARKRLYVPGLQSTNYYAHAVNDIGFVQAENIVKRNVKKLTCKIKRKYTITRPVIAGATELSGESEDSFFNKYYNNERSIVCRVQAWPLDPLFTGKPNTSSIAKAGFMTLNNTYDNAFAALTNDATNNGEVISSVMCRMEKRSYITFDAIILKGPFRG